VGADGGDLADEDVAVLVGLGEVGSEEGVVESETSARLASDVEVSQEFGSLLVHFFILNAHNTGVEWLSGVSADLGLVLELNTGVLEETSQEGGSEFSLRKVVEVDEVFVLGLHLFGFGSVGGFVLFFFVFIID
jgi:hypothetical protein